MSDILKLSYEEYQDRYRQNLLHNGSIGCYVPDPKQESEIVKVWRQCVEVDVKVEVQYPVFKKVRRYATQWRAVKWAPHFYDLVDVLDYFKTLPVAELHYLSGKQYYESRIFVRRTARTGSRQQVRVPVMPEASFIEPEMNAFAVHRIESITYDFPLIQSVEEVSVQAYPDWKRNPRMIEGATEDFLRQAERMVESKTKVSHSRDVTIGNLPTFRVTKST